MTSRDFCYWLQGYFEIKIGEVWPTDEEPEPSPLNSLQVQIIKTHLNMVFKHEIDPSFGGPEKQKELQDIHRGITVKDLQVPGYLTNPLDAKLNC